jgi:anti-anti-sigma factor
MPVVHDTNTTEPTRHFTSPGIGADGIRLSTQIEHAATIVAASGDIDASNIDRLTDYVQSALAQGRALILDLSDLTFFGAQGIPALFSVSEQCSKAGVDWAVVSSHAVRRLLRIGDRDSRLPAVSSVPEALKRLATPTPSRPLLQLVTKSG